MSTNCPAFPFPRNNTYHPAPDNQQLRQNESVSRVQLFDGRKAWCLTKHEDIKQALSSNKLSADRRTDGFPELHEDGKRAREEKPTFVNLDDPEHDVQRNMLEASFERSAVDKLRPMFQQVVDQVIGKLLHEYKGKSEPVDFIEEFAAPIPTQIIYRVLGVPEEDVEKLSQDSSVRTGTSRTAAEQANQSLNNYMHDFVQKAAKHPNDGLTSRLIEEQMKPGHLTEEEVVQLSFLVLTAGNAALTNSIGLGILTLFDHPKQFDEIKKDPERLVPGMVTELLRWNTASALNSRRAVVSDTSFRGQEVKQGDAVICAVQAGDRDEDATSNAESFDIHRQEYGLDKVLGFGFGPHRCIADYFSQVQLEIVFTQLVKRMGELELAQDERELPYSAANQNVGVLKLPIRIA